MAVIKTVGEIHFDKEKNKWIITEALPHVCIKLKAVFNKIPKTGVVPFYFAPIPFSTE